MKSFKSSFICRSQFKANLFPLGKDNLLSLCQPLPVRGQLLSLYTSCQKPNLVFVCLCPPTCLTIAPLWFPACHKWCSIGILLMLDTMMLCSDPLFSLADLFSSLGKISWWSLQLCPFLSSDLSKTTICSKGKAKSRVANRDLEKNNS